MPGTTFYDIFKRYRWQEINQAIYSACLRDVEAALNRTSRLRIEDFIALVSPAAAPLLEEIKQRSDDLTRKRFGNVIQMYAPMYVSNECQNICTYCGFSLSNKIPRVTLNSEQIEQEIAAIRAMGFKHILIVSGEAQKTVGLEYFLNIMPLLRAHFPNITFEVQPLKEEEYKKLIEAGLYAVLVYQETYNEDRYTVYHPKGKKSNFRYRLETPDRMGAAGIHKIGLGTLIGLEDWRTDACFTALHLAYLRKKYWRSLFSVSFPRIRPAEGLIEPQSVMNDNQLLQLICAFRLFDENLELSLSTREPAAFRDELVRFGITSMSAGSKTEPGGYSLSRSALKQFEIDDNRSPSEVAARLGELGFEAVWKNGDKWQNLPA